MVTFGAAAGHGRQSLATVPVGWLALVAITAWLAGITLAWMDAVTPWMIAAAFLIISGLAVALNGVLGETRARQRDLERDLAAAQRVQRALLPADVPQLRNCDFAMVYRMSKAIGGDCVDVIALGPSRLMLLVGDVSGKGIAAALVMSSVQATFRTLARLNITLDQIAARIDDQLLEQGDGHYVTAVMLTLDTESGAIEYVSAGHLPFVLADRTDVRAIGANGPPLGLLAGTRRETARTSVSHPAHLLLVTDGVTERSGPSGDYGFEAVTRAAAVLTGDTSRVVVETILAANDSHAHGGVADDDLTIVALRLRQEDNVVAARL